MAKKQSDKREDAERRQDKYDSLSHLQKVKRAQSRRGESKKELLRLIGKRSEKFEKLLKNITTTGVKND